MGGKNKLLIVFLSVIFCFSLFSLSAFAANEVENQGGYSDVETGDDQSVSGENSDGNVEIPSENVGSESNNDADNNNSGGNEDYPQESNVGESSDIYSDNNVDNNNVYSDNNVVNGNSGDYYEYNEQSSYEQESIYDEPSYVGGGQTYVPPENIAPSASLYNSRESISEKTLNGGDWKDISERLKNAGSNAGDSDDFSFIQKNNSLSDNGGWMLIVSILCFVFSAAGIVYFIVLTVQNNKKSRFAPAKDIGRASNQRTGRDYYNDGYRASSGKSSKKYSKFDTADVRLPKNTQAKRYNKGGRRYK